MKIELDDKQADFLLRALMNNYADVPEDFEPGHIGDRGTVGFLIGKMAHGKLYDRYCELSDERWKKEEFDSKYLFMGAGWHSTITANKLFKRIRYAIGVLGGMQQNGGQGTEFDEATDKEDKASLVAVVRDVMTAFGVSVEDLK